MTSNAPYAGIDAALDAEAARLIDRWAQRTRALVPEGAEIYDAHVHLGTDVGGMVGRADHLLDTMDAYGVTRCNVFCLDEPDRQPAFRAGNDRTLAFAQEAPGRLVPFVRLDLADGPVEEARRCLDRGARGIKLHPRAQRFDVGDVRLDPIFALAAERGVPILIHGGLGLPPIADRLGSLVESHPGAQLIIAHAGIADMARLTAVFAGRAGVFFDTSTWSATDVAGLLGLVGPEQVLYASDFPYGQQPGFLLVALRAARVAGLTEDEVRDLLGRTAAGIADGRAASEPSGPRGASRVSQPVVMSRISRYAAGAMALLWSAQPDRLDLLGLALNACEVGEGGRDDEVVEIAELLGAARALWRTMPELEGSERRHASRAVFRLLHIADTLASTSLD